MIAFELAAALERAARSLEAGDAVAALPEAEKSRALCDAARAGDTRFAPGEMASLRALLARGMVAAARKGAELDRARRHVASSRRAHVAYAR